MRQSVRVLAREGLRVRLANNAGDIVKFKFITSKGLLDERTGEVAEGPVVVPLTRYFARLLAADNLLQVQGEAQDAPGTAEAPNDHAPEAPAPEEDAQAPEGDTTGSQPRMKRRRTEG